MGRYRFRRRTPLADRFWPKVDRRSPDECWLWTGAHHPAGYGRIGIGGSGSRMAPATHVAWMLCNGTPVPPGMLVCHHCDNPPCVNPAHLFIGTPKDNQQDMSRKGRAKAPRLRGSSHPLRVDPSRAARGEEHGCALLTAESVVAIRNAFSCGERITSLARRFGVARPTIRRVVLRETWRHVA